MVCGLTRVGERRHLLDAPRRQGQEADETLGSDSCDHAHVNSPPP